MGGGRDGTRVGLAAPTDTGTVAVTMALVVVVEVVVAVVVRGPPILAVSPMQWCHGGYDHDGFPLLPN